MAEFVEVMKQKKRMCETMKSGCSSCRLGYDNNDCHVGCNTFISDYYEQAEEIIMKWAEDNPIKTNADKFKEVFGKEPRGCIFENYDCNCEKCNDCKNADFWQQEYKEPKGE